MEKINMDTIDKLKSIREIDKKFTVAALGILIAYQNVKGDSPQLDVILLGLASSFIDQAQLLENKLDHEKYQELLLSLKHAPFEDNVTKLAQLTNNEELSEMLNYLATDNHE